jgi:lactaldehyde dehydrogenase / glycolaldehyde dehydrogenase
VCRLKVGDPFDDATDLGPKITQVELQKIERMVANVRKKGAEVVTGGKRAEVAGFEGGRLLV